MNCETLREARLEVLYGEASPETLALVRRHEQDCAVCREETAAFDAVRRDLASWTLAEPGRLASARAFIPRWLVLAATLVLATGGALGLARPDLTWSQGSVRLSFGGSTLTPAAASAEIPRQRAEIEQLRAALARLEATPRPMARPVSLSEAEVATLLRASEERQKRAIEARLSAFGGQVETQRRLDFARMSAGLAYLDQRSGRDSARTNELMGYVLQASQRR